MESWFHNLWRTSQKHDTVPEKPVIGVLAFEVANLMSKLVHLWQSLADKQVKKMRELISGSVGIKKLVSDDEDYVVRLISAEMIDNLGNVARAVVRLGKKCLDPSLNNLEKVFDDLIKFGGDIYGLELAWKKMEQTVKKMQKLISINSNLFREWEALSDLEQTLRRMSSCSESDSKDLLEYQKKIAWKQREVKHLQEKSLWNKTYVDMVMLMTRSVFTIFIRIKHVFGLGHREETMKVTDSKPSHSDYLHRAQSVSAAPLQSSSVHPSESSIPRFSSGPLLKKLTVHPGPLPKAHEKYNSYSGPIGGRSTKSGPIHRANKVLNSYSGPLVQTSLAHSGPSSKRSIFGLKLWHNRKNSSTLDEKLALSKPDQLPEAETLTAQLDLLNFKSRLLDAPPETLGAAALALHYANVIFVIEKLVASPHLIGHDARDDLYYMLPSSIRASIRARLKPFSKVMDSSVKDTALAREWNEAMTRILEWLAPLAHNTVKWQSERSYEQQGLSSRGNVLLVQTLHFVNQEKAEAIITELLVGLNYVWRFGREISAEAFLDCNSTTKLCDYLYEAP